MTADEIVRFYENEWHTPARLVLSRVHGNRSAYSVISDGDDRVGVDHRWTGEGLDFQPRGCPPMCACLDDLTDCPVPAEDTVADQAQRWNEQRGA